MKINLKSILAIAQAEDSEDWKIHFSNLRPFEWGENRKLETLQWRAGGLLLVKE